MVDAGIDSGHPWPSGFARAVGAPKSASCRFVEPWMPLDMPVFKTGAFNRSANPPWRAYQDIHFRMLNVNDNSWG